MFKLKVLAYDYYGSYDTTKHQNYEYEKRLQQDYTFDLPKHFDIVRFRLRFTSASRCDSEP